jgi:hypothetical protein
MIGSAGRTNRANALLDKVQRSFHPTRSPDVVIVQSQFWYLYPDADAYAAMHGSPYSHDTFVPIIVAGMCIKSSLSYDPVSPGQIAPTIAALLKTKPPSGNTAAVLPEAVGRFQ